MKTHVLPILLLSAIAGTAFAVPTVHTFVWNEISTHTTIYDAATNQTATSAYAAFDGSEEEGIGAPANGYSILIDFSGYVSEKKPKVYVTEIEVVHVGRSKFSLWTADVVKDKNSVVTNWTPVVGAQNVQQAGRSLFKPATRALLVRYVFNTSANDNDLLELRIRGWKTSEPTKISNVARSLFIRGGQVSVGCAGTNGGHYTDRFFNGNFTDYAYCNGNGVTELVIPTTALDSLGNDTGVPQYVTEFLVGHIGNAPYSLYYTTDATPDYSQYEMTITDNVAANRHWAHPTTTNYVGGASDNRKWIAIDGAQTVQEAGTKTYLVNKTVTAVKYVFDTCPNWTTHLAEVEVLAMDPDDLPCTHTNLDLTTAIWTVCSPPTCTENAFEECFCPDCNLRFEREVPLSKLGHDFVATLTRPGRHDRWGSGYVTCARTIEDPDTHETTWACDYRIDFDGEDVDLTTLGGPPINGVVQYTDLTVSSTGAEDGGVKPIYVMDGYWDSGWGHAWYAGTLSHDEYVQYAFGTSIELTKIEYSVLNQHQTVDFYKYDPETGEETLLKTISIAKVETFEDRQDPETGEITHLDTSPGYQRLSVDFFVTDKSKKTFVDAIRMRIGDYIDPETGAVTKYIGEKYGGNDWHTIICELHPFGTIEGAGPLTHNPATILLLR